MSQRIVLKKQFRLYDIYRYRAIREQSNIRGITKYNVTNCTVEIEYNNGIEYRHFYSNEEELKGIVRTINKTLNNCDTPGPKKTKYRQMRLPV